MMLKIPYLAIPESTNYMIFGYIVIFSVMLIYVLSLILRSRKLEQDIKLLDEIEVKHDNL